MGVEGSNVNVVQLHAIKNDILPLTMLKVEAEKGGFWIRNGL